MKYFKTRTLKVLKEFKESSRDGREVQRLQEGVFGVCDAIGVNKNLIDFIQQEDDRGRYVASIIIKNIPFIKTYKITLDDNI